MNLRKTLTVATAALGGALAGLTLTGGTASADAPTDDLEAVVHTPPNADAKLGRVLRVADIADLSGGRAVADGDVTIVVL
ncbi:hypothetical protein GCM10022243_28410 [Saccharothrix violaceirubra]|uniref:Uncharacterized protein n=1 Tax=Saccharothrix violaceirubra TaxID=413306 RepID=A0A7W7T9X5_9PSEU|nr:hypothetical protein [Saccharothrix violaceirubra]MBB4969234.1 hypothetical protein [Saccharothrix violaceirubra]